jgi:hypothetical protein
MHLRQNAAPGVLIQHGFGLLVVKVRAMPGFLAVSQVLIT